MLVIRLEQMRRLEAARFEDWMVGHLRRCFADHEWQSAGELRAFIRKGIDRAQTHRMPMGPLMCQFIDLMMVFGPTFERDPRFPWAREALTSRGPPARRAARLHDAAMAYLRSGRR